MAFGMSSNAALVRFLLLPGFSLFLFKLPPVKCLSCFSSKGGNCIMYEYICALTSFPNHVFGDASCYPDLDTNDNWLKLEVLNYTFAVSYCFEHHSFSRQPLYHLYIDSQISASKRQGQQNHSVTTTLEGGVTEVLLIGSLGMDVWNNTEQLVMYKYIYLCMAGLF